MLFNFLKTYMIRIAQKIGIKKESVYHILKIYS